jgi:hypothetical protein
MAATNNATNQSKKRKLAANVTASPTTSISSLPPHTATTASGGIAAGGGAVRSTGLHRRGTEGSVLRDDDEEDEGSQMGGSQVGGRGGSVNKDGKDTKDGKDGGAKRVKRNRVHFSCVEVSRFFGTLRAFSVTLTVRFVASSLRRFIAHFTARSVIGKSSRQSYLHPARPANHRKLPFSITAVNKK